MPLPNSTSTSSVKSRRRCRQLLATWSREIDKPSETANHIKLYGSYWRKTERKSNSSWESVETSRQSILSKSKCMICVVR